MPTKKEQKKDGLKGMLSKLDEVCQDAESAIEQGYSFIVLSDK